MRTSYDVILRRADKAMERSWRWSSTAIAAVLGGVVVFVAGGHPAPFSSILDLPPLLLAAFWVFSATTAWAVWFAAKAATWVRFWRSRGPFRWRSRCASIPTRSHHTAPPAAAP